MPDRGSRQWRRMALPVVHRRPLKKPPGWPERETNQTKSGSSLCKHRKSKQVFCNTVQALYHLVPTKTSKNAFYLQPLRNPTPHCWYVQEPLGHNKLADTVSRLWKSAGIKGVKTNHSLCHVPLLIRYWWTVDNGVNWPLKHWWCTAI